MHVFLGKIRCFSHIPKRYRTKSGAIHLFTYSGKVPFWFNSLNLGTFSLYYTMSPKTYCLGIFFLWSPSATISSIALLYLEACHYAPENFWVSKLHNELFGLSELHWPAKRVQKKKRYCGRCWWFSIHQANYVKIIASKVPENNVLLFLLYIIIT